MHKGAVLRDQGIERVARGASQEWRESAAAAIDTIAKKRKYFTTDDVWNALSEIPDEPRAMGAMMTLAKKLGVIEATEEFQLSARPECHRRPLRVWASRIYQEVRS